MAISADPNELHAAPGRLDREAARARTELLYLEHGRTVSGLCRALLRSQTEAEDATQQVFLAAHRAIANGSVPREPAAWLATIARNECWARIGDRMREPLPSDSATEAAGASDALGDAIRRADVAALCAAIRELPAQQRDALILRELRGLSYEEVGAALSVTTPAVESLLFRARRGIRARLEGAYAAITGASWLDVLFRVLAGSTAPAAKAVAIGLGAAAVTGGAVVAPHVLDRPHAPVPLHEPPATVRASTPIRVLPAARVFVVRASPRSDATPRERDDSPSTAQPADGADAADPGSSTAASDDATAADAGSSTAASDDATAQDGVAAPPASTTGAPVAAGDDGHGADAGGDQAAPSVAGPSGDGGDTSGD